MIQNAVVHQLRAGGVRVTPQRLAIAEAVLNSTDHPTVQQIHERVQQHFPSMTLATVYSTLGVLTKSGLIQELPFARQSRYESNMAPHINLVCMGCGSIADAEDSGEIITRLRQQVADATRFQVLWQRVDFHGWCRACAGDGAVDSNGSSHADGGGGPSGVGGGNSYADGSSGQGGAVGGNSHADGSGGPGGAVAGNSHADRIGGQSGDVDVNSHADRIGGPGGDVDVNSHADRIGGPGGDVDVNSHTDGSNGQRGAVGGDSHTDGSGGQGGGVDGLDGVVL